MRFIIGIGIGLIAGYFVGKSFSNHSKNFFVKRISMLSGGVTVEEYLADDGEGGLMYVSDKEDASIFSENQARIAINLLKQTSSPLNIVMEEVQNMVPV